MERKVTIEDKKLLKLLNKKNDVVEEIKSFSDKIDELEKERYEVAVKLDELKAEIVPVAQVHVKGVELSEFEQVRTVDVEEGEIILNITDSVEEYKERLREAKLEKETEEK